MNFDKIRDFCSKFRIVIGLAFIVTAIALNNAWFYLGLIPLIAGLVKFCPICIISKQCSTK